MDKEKSESILQLELDFEDDGTNVIDFEDLRLKKLQQAEEDARKEVPLEEDNESVEIYASSDDPTHNLQYPLVSKSEPPVGVPKPNIREMWFQTPWYVKLRSRFLVSEYTPFQCGCIHGYLGLYTERTRHLTSFPYIIHPYSDFMTFWNLFMGINLLINFIYSPYLIAFEPFSFVSHSIWINNLFVSSTLLLDLVFNFMTGIRNKYSGKVEFDPRVIIYKYFTGWFLFDLLSRAPIDALLILQLTDEEKAVKTNLETIRIIALVTRTLRYRKIYEILCRISEILQIRSLVVPWVLKLVVFILFCFHWMACFHWLLPDVVNARLPAPKPKSWVTHYDLWRKSHFEQYINAYLRSLSNLLTLDGGNFIPRETEEIFCTIIGIFLSVLLFGYFISSFSAIMGDIHASKDRFEESYGMIQDYMTIKRVPLPLQEKVKTFFDRKYRGHMFSDAALMTTISPSLRIEIACHNCRALIEKVPLFHKIPPSVIVELSELLEYEVYVPGDVLITAETQGDAMYFILTGEVHVLNVFGEKQKTLTDGEFFGEVALITHERTRETVVVQAPSEIYKLSKANFHGTVEANAEAYEKITEIARQKLKEEKRRTDEESRRAQDQRNWKHIKKLLAESLKETDATVIDTTGIDFVGSGSEEDEPSIPQRNTSGPPVRQDDDDSSSGSETDTSTESTDLQARK